MYSNSTVMRQYNIKNAHLLSVDLVAIAAASERSDQVVGTSSSSSSDSTAAAWASTWTGLYRRSDTSGSFMQCDQVDAYTAYEVTGTAFPQTIVQRVLLPNSAFSSNCSAECDKHLQCSHAYLITDARSAEGCILYAGRPPVSDMQSGDPERSSCRTVRTSAGQQAMLCVKAGPMLRCKSLIEQSTGLGWISGTD